MRVSYGIFALLITLTACSGKKRPFADGPIEGLGGSGGSSTSPTDQETDANVPGPEPTATEGQPPVDRLSPPDDDIQSSGSLACEADAGECTVPDAGPMPAACVPTGPRDCTSDLDNDCDGEPDNALDDVCLCVAGTSGPCDEHPGLDGQGACRAGLRTCLLDEAALTTAWSACEDAVGPGDADSCEPGDDADCDGTPNEGCSCTDGVTQPCGSTTNTGPCQIGVSTCVDGQFGPCVGAVAPAGADSCSSRNDDSNCNSIPFDGCSCVNGETAPCGMTDTGVCEFGSRTCVNGAFGQCVGAVNPRSRDCRSQQDNDCDGRPDNTIDSVCTCTVGQTQACQEHPQDGVGPCRAGSQTCEGRANNATSAFSACTGSVGPAVRDTCTAGNDANCNGVANEGCLQDGATCTSNAACASGVCTRWFSDQDGDGFGGSTETARTCGSVGPSGSANRSGDCCDLGGASRAVGARVNPGQQAFFYEAQGNCLDIDGYDYNCDGNVEFENPGTSSCAEANDCTRAHIWAGYDDENPGCGIIALSTPCIRVGGACVADETPGLTTYRESRCR